MDEDKSGQHHEANQFGSAYPEPKLSLTQDQRRQEKNRSDAPQGNGSSGILVLLYVVCDRLS
jgi:hypothetical protein